MCSGEPADLPSPYLPLAHLRGGTPRLPAVTVVTDPSAALRESPGALRAVLALSLRERGMLRMPGYRGPGKPPLTRSASRPLVLSHPPGGCRAPCGCIAQPAAASPGNLRFPVPSRGAAEPGGLSGLRPGKRVLRTLCASRGALAPRTLWFGLQAGGGLSADLIKAPDCVGHSPLPGAGPLRGCREHPGSPRARRAKRQVRVSRPQAPAGRAPTEEQGHRGTPAG